MALKIIEQKDGNDRWLEAGERLFQTADLERIVSESDPDAAYLFAAEGDRISAEDAKQYGLKRG